MIQALRAMNVVDRLGYPQLEEDDAFDQQVSTVHSPNTFL
jgi:hypothetical protein